MATKVTIVAQDLFNKAWERAKVPEKFFTKEGCCFYAGKCFIGCALDHKKATFLDSLDDNRVRHIIQIGYLNVTKPPVGLAVDFAEVLQAIHDDYEPYDWPGQLRNLAIAHGLTVPEDTSV